MLTWDLEYLLLFGPPQNKLELLDGITPCSFPFMERAMADAHFERWAQTLARWQAIPNPSDRLEDGARVKQFGRFRLEQYRRPIRLEVPSQFNAFEWAYTSFWERSLWPMQPAGFETGYDVMQDHWDIKHNLWSIFRDAQDRLGFQGRGIGGVDISLTDKDCVQPDYFFFLGDKKKHLVANQYFRGVPHLVVEVLSPYSRAIDRGPRKEVYRRARVPHLWLIEPLTRTIETYRWDRNEYHLSATLGIGEELIPEGFDPFNVSVDKVFDTQSSHFESNVGECCDPIPHWAISREQVVGLQHLILLGHTERRREIWNNRAPCVLAFGSADEARHRLDHFLLEAARWEDAPVPSAVEHEPDVVTADVGRFHFLRQAHIVRLNVDVDALLYRSLLDVTAQREAWDWGEESRPA